VVVFGCASVLLSYPGSSAQEFEKDLLSVEDALCRLSSSRARDCLMDTRTWLASIPLEEAAAYYVSTFDLNDQHALHLTYHALGDTRQRGMALAALVDAYHEAGFQLVPGELPDFLPALLEFAAVCEAGRKVLSQYRSVLQTLYHRLEMASNRYAKVLEAIGYAVGFGRFDRLTSSLRLKTAEPPIPPIEEVGLELLPTRGAPGFPARPMQPGNQFDSFPTPGTSVTSEDGS